jgi:hypothetical protein
MRKKSPHQTTAVHALETTARGNGVPRGWMNYFAVGHSCECFTLIKNWVEKKVRPHMMRARKRAERAWRTATMISVDRQTLQLLPLVLLVLFLVAVLLVGGHQGTAIAAGDSVAAAVQAMLSLSASGKFLYRTIEAKAALGCGTTKLYALINSGVLETRRFGKRTYITAESLEAFVASLPPVVTPTMAKAEHEKWSAHRKRPKPQEDEVNIA